MKVVNKMRTLIGVPAALGLLAGAVCMGGCDSSGASVATAPTAVETRVLQIVPKEVSLTTELPGRAFAYRVAEIRPQVNGIIQKRLFEEGSEVKAGEVLYQIDPASFQAALDNAGAALVRAESKVPALRLRLQRYKALLEREAVSHQDFDDTEAALKQAEADVAVSKAALESARINLGYTKIVAPISGRIGKSSVTDGALVTAHQVMPLATVQQIDPMYVDIPESARALLDLRRHLEDGRLNQDGANQNLVKIMLEDGTTHEFDGTLQFRDVTVDATTGSVTLRVVVPNPRGLLLPGMFVKASIREGVNSRAIMVPQQSVLRDPKGNPYALTVGPDEKAEQRMLVLDRAIDDQWLVSKGLQAGDRIAVENLQKLKAGTTIKVLSSDAPAVSGGTAQSKP